MFSFPLFVNAPSFLLLLLLLVLTSILSTSLPSICTNFSTYRYVVTVFVFCFPSPSTTVVLVTVVTTRFPFSSRSIRVEDGDGLIVGGGIILEIYGDFLHC